MKGKPGDVYNIASGKETTILELATKINHLTGNKAKLKFLPKRAWDTSGKRFGSTEKSKKELGFEAKVSVDEGLQKTVEWTRNNLNLIKKTISKHKKKLLSQPPV